MSHLTIRGRCMYPHVHQPHKFKDAPSDQEAQYTVDIVIAENDPNVAKIVEQTNQLIAAELDGVQPTPQNYPIKTDPSNPAIAGHVILRAKSRQKPSVIDEFKNPIMDPAKPGDGDWCWFNVKLFAYNTKGNKGVSAALNGVMFEQAGSGRLAKTGPPSVDEMFGHIQTQPQQGYQQPQQGYQQPQQGYQQPQQGYQQPQQPQHGYPGAQDPSRPF